MLTKEFFLIWTHKIINNVINKILIIIIDHNHLTSNSALP